jgi:hypothetical protein
MSDHRHHFVGHYDGMSAMCLECDIMPETIIQELEDALEEIRSLPMDHAQPCRIIASRALGKPFSGDA